MWCNYFGMIAVRCHPLINDEPCKHIFVSCAVTHVVAFLCKSAVTCFNFTIHQMISEEMKYRSCCHYKNRSWRNPKPLEKVFSQWAISVFIITRGSSIYIRDLSLVIFVRRLPDSNLSQPEEGPHELSVQCIKYLGDVETCYFYMFSYLIFVLTYCIFDVVKPQANIYC